MKHINDGGSAFPHPAVDMDSDTEEYGMTKRDLFSALILSGAIQNADGSDDASSWAEYAVKYADALIEALD